MPSRERVAALIERVEQGKYVEALQEFYAEDATMQENGNPPRVGLKALVEQSRRRSAVYDVLTNGTDVVIDVTTP